MAWTFGFRDKIRTLEPNDFGRSFLAGDEGFSFSENPLVRFSSSLSLFLIALSAIAAYVFIIRGEEGTIVLHYNAYFGVDIVGDPWQVLLVPASALSFFLIDFILARKLYSMRERIAAHIILFSSFFAALSGAVAVAALSSINS